jgi:hypothetical protein
MKTSSVIACTLSAAVLGCAPLDDPMSVAVSPLQSETGSGESVRFMYRAYKSRPDLTLASYAVGFSVGNGLNGSTPVAPAGGGCTTEMIGPNVMMTAAHCGFNDDRVLRFTYVTNFGAPDPQDRAIVRSLEWPVACRRLLQSFLETSTSSDLMLYYCPSNAQGLGPGDIYGWLDFDAADVSMGQTVASVFTTGSGSLATSVPLPAPGVPFATPQYGFGGVLLNARQGCSSTDPPVAVNIPGEGGNSGSVMFNTSTWRAAVGPLSVFGTSSCGWPTNARWARSMAGYRAASRVRTGLTPPHIVDANINGLGLGLNPANYASASPGTLLDGDGDRVFDLQADIELASRENARDWVFLGFGSPRRNRLWTRDAAVTFLPDVGAGVARVSHAGGYKNLLRHTRLRLQPGASYRISVMTTTTSQGSSTPLSIGFCNVVGGACQYTAARFLPTQASATQTFTVSGTTLANATSVFLDVDAHAAYAGDIYAVSVVRNNDTPGVETNAAWMDFDTHDTRVNWRNDITGGRAVIVPDGRTTAIGTSVLYADGTGLFTLAPDWALYVERDLQQPAGWPARNGQLALVANRRYTLCFHTFSATPANTTGVVRVQSWNGSAWVNSLSPLSFPLTSAWTSQCSGTFTVAGDMSSLQFGFAGSAATGQHYLIDDLRIVEQP